MKIGTLRAEEARVFDSAAGYHQFHDEETGEAHGSFEVFWLDHDDEPDDDFAMPSGWYWIAGFPGCMPDSDGPSGPFAYSWLAKWDADPWSEDNDPL